VLLAAAALHELWGSRGEAVAAGLRRLGGRVQRSSTGRLMTASAAPRIEARIRGAGLQSRLERSGWLGSPLAAGLQAQASALRTEQGRAMAEEAARAAPKIQLVVAVMLVPSVLLLVGAAIAANAESLLSGLA